MNQWNFPFFLSSVERYDYIINGEALGSIKEYMKEEHTFADFTVVGFTGGGSMLPVTKTPFLIETLNKAFI